MKVIYFYIFLSSSILFSQNNINSFLNFNLDKIIDDKNLTKNIKLFYEYNNNNYIWINSPELRKNLFNILNNLYFNYKELDLNRKKISKYLNIYYNRIIINFDLEKFAELDILLTSSYFLLIDFIINSNINWESFNQKLNELKDKDGNIINTYWKLKKASFPKVYDIYESIINDDILSFLQNITPIKNKHNNLIYMLKFYKKIKYYQNIPYGRKLKLGDMDKRLIAIKKRLSLYGDLAINQNFNNKFDNSLLRALYLYNSRFNLIQNNIIDNITILNLNKPIKKLIKKIYTNLDKLKISEDFHNLKNFISINIPSFSMNLVLDKVLKLNMDVVIGRTTRPTPIFKDSISYLKVNPYWFIPDSLVRKDLIPALKIDENYLENHNIHVSYNWNPKSKRININLAKDLFPYEYTKKYIPYKFIQFPGDKNPLGKIKFMFPNKHSVYLHDTADKKLFNYEYRLYSSGCIRLKKPFLLFQYMKNFIPTKHFNNIKLYLKNKTNIRITLLKKLPIYTTYFTVFRKNNRIYFRQDIYKYDKLIEESEKRDLI